MNNGFQLSLHPYCSFCGEFEPENNKIDVTRLGDKHPVYLNTIYCSNASFCEKLKEHLKSTVKEDDFTGEH